MNTPILAATGLDAEFIRITQQIESASLEESLSAHEKIEIARAWARIQEDAEELARKLIWLEAILLRRIGQLDPCALKHPKRQAASYFAELSDADLGRFLEDYPARSATGAYIIWVRSQKVESQKQKGRQFALGRRERVPYKAHHVDDEAHSATLRLAMEERVVTVRQAAAIIVDEYATDAITVTDVVDRFIKDWSPIPDDATPLQWSAFRDGLSEAVRQAFISAPVETTEKSWEIPAFITTFNEETREWLRVPSIYARVSDARQMLALRRGQIESMSRALEALEDVLIGRFAVDTRDGAEYLRTDITAMQHQLVRAGQERMCRTLEQSGLSA